jgi:hypothetical protein
MSMLSRLSRSRERSTLCFDEVAVEALAARRRLEISADLGRDQRGLRQLLAEAPFPSRPCRSSRRFEQVEPNASARSITASCSASVTGP